MYLRRFRSVLKCNNSIFDNRDFLQTDGTAQGPHMCCSYKDIAMSKLDTAALQYHYQPTLWKRFQDDVLVTYTHGSDTLESFLDYRNQTDSAGKIKFTMQVQDEDGIEFLDLKLKLENSKIAVDVFAKPTNSFTYVLPSSWYPRKSINNIPCGIALRLRRICDTDEKFNSRSIEYKNYLIARDCKPSLVNKHFAHASTLSRQQARQKSNNRKSQGSKNVKLIMKYNSRLPDLNSLLKKDMTLLYTDPTLKTIFQQGCINSVFKRNQSLKEL